MSFIEQAAKIFSGTAEFKFHAVMFGRDAFYIEGARPIKIDENEMIFRAAGELITLTGDGMKIKDLSSDCASITGRIDGFSVKSL